MSKAKRRRDLREAILSNGHSSVMGKGKRRNPARGALGERCTEDGRDPARNGWPVASLLQIAFRSAKILLLGALTLLYSPLLLVLFVLAALVNGTLCVHLQTPDLSQVLRFINYAVKSEEDLDFVTRFDICLKILRHTFHKYFSAGCFLLDEILYGRQLDAVSVDAPLFVLSAYRSASTEMARMLEKDAERFACPTALMCAFPYLWLWNLVAWIGFEGFTREELNGYLNKNMGAESLARHETDHFAVDTYDGFFLSRRLNGLAFHLGADVIVGEFNASEYEEHNKQLFRETFVNDVDRMARKTLYFNRATSSRKFLLKGHFLSSAAALQARYPDARFLTVVRCPLKRLRSAINHTAVNSTIWLGRAPRWDWLGAAFERIEAEYCRREMAWYGLGGDDRPRRLAVTFDDFVRDFNGTMEYVYRELLEGNARPKFKAPPKKRKYSVDKSLEELGIDEQRLRTELAAYYVWMKKVGSDFASKKRDKYQ